jgi:hypothetical protein
VVNVSINWATGAVYVRGGLVGWLQPATLAAVKGVLQTFVKGVESLFTGITVTLPNPDGSQSTNTQQTALFPGVSA